MASGAIGGAETSGNAAGASYRLSSARSVARWSAPNNCARCAGDSTNKFSIVVVPLCNYVLTRAG